MTTNKVTNPKRDRFVRVGGMRHSKLIKQIKLLGQCGSSNYSFTEKDVEKMELSIAKALNEMYSQFVPREEKKEEVETNIFE